jgi:hypothetical protein
VPTGMRAVWREGGYAPRLGVGGTAAWAGRLARARPRGPCPSGAPCPSGTPPLHVTSPPISNATVASMPTTRPAPYRKGMTSNLAHRRRATTVGARAYAHVRRPSTRSSVVGGLPVARPLRRVTTRSIRRGTTHSSRCPWPLILPHLGIPTIRRFPGRSLVTCDGPAAAPKAGPPPRLRAARQARCGGLSWARRSGAAGAKPERRRRSTPPARHGPLDDTSPTPPTRPTRHGPLDTVGTDATGTVAGPDSKTTTSPTGRTARRSSHRPGSRRGHLGEVHTPVGDERPKAPLRRLAYAVRNPDADERDPARPTSRGGSASANTTVIRGAGQGRRREVPGAAAVRRAGRRPEAGRRGDPHCESPARRRAAGGASR